MHYLNKYIKVLDKGFIGLVNFLGSDELIENSARVSYAGNNKKKDTGRLINYLIRKKHSSPLEMCEAIFHVKMPLFCAQQWTRHRTQNFNFLSFRYCEPKEEVYTPDWREQAKKNKQSSGEKIDNKELDLLYKYSVDLSFSTYKDLITQGVARELARSVIPTSTYTECYVKSDLRNWFNFLTLRSDEHAQYEIQVYSDALGSFLQELFPISFKAFIKHQFNSVSFTLDEMRFLIERPFYGEFSDKTLNIDFLKDGNKDWKIWDTDSEIEDFIKKIRLTNTNRFNISNYNLKDLKEVDNENNQMV